VILVVLVSAALATLRVGARPEIVIESSLPGIGKRTPIAIDLKSAGRGLAMLRVELQQGDLTESLTEKAYESRPAWAFWGPRTIAERLDLEVGSDTVTGLREGEATIRVEASGPRTWLRQARIGTAELTLRVQLRPPSLSLVSTQHYPTQGGCEVAVYRVGPTAVRDGVHSGDEWFPGSPLAASGDLRFALFAVPFDVADATTIRLEAEDAVGNRATLAFVDKFFSRAFETDTIEVSESFMTEVVAEILANTTELEDREGLLENYLAINGTLREANARVLRALGEDSREEFLWEEAFAPMPNAQVMSAFADRRTYLHQGLEVDRQDHLGFDLASVKRAVVPAANRGVVVLAGYFGIYGNAVVVDHGYGLMSLYGHLSSVEVEEGQEVSRGETLGRTGDTGLAAGDHLHFTMLLNGTPVNPVEWWDGKWIRDRLKRKLGDALPFAG
jgi:murein DD-endopeptidase MepM/ murein hydrolase activator NlpD